MPASNVIWQTPLTRLNPWYPGQFGVPGTDSETGLRLDTNGTVFYVDPNAIGVSDGRDGTDPTEPLATVAAALTKCEAYRNDVIIVAPNGLWPYADPTSERLTGITEEVTVNVPGVRIIGLFPSSSVGVPWYTTTDDGACIAVNSIDVLIEGFVFQTGAGVTGGTGILVQWGGVNWGDNVTVRHCHFIGGVGDLDYGIIADYSWYSDISYNAFHALQEAAIAVLAVGSAGDPDFSLIHHNWFYMNAYAINLPDVDGCYVYDNAIVGTVGVNPTFINIDGANNIVSNNFLACTAAEADTVAPKGATDFWIYNHCTDGEH